MSISSPAHIRQLRLAVRLYELLEEFNAELYYTTDDDGIHMSIDGVEVFKDEGESFGFFDRVHLLTKAAALANRERADV
jgi:hypothetical protein